MDSLCTGNATRTCGNGIATRSRTILTQPQGNGGACPSLSEQATCVTQCSVDCVEAVWSQWSACTATCGGGKSSRARQIDVASQFCGRACGDTSEEQTCNTQACTPILSAVDCVVSAYEVAAKERCSVPACGGGNWTARATVVTPAQGNGKACPPLEQLQPCNTVACPAIIVNSTGLRWRLTSSDSYESFVWMTFRWKLAFYLLVDEHRLQLNSAVSGSTVVELTLLDAVSDAASNYVFSLQRIAGNESSGLNVVSSSSSIESVSTTSVAETTASDVVRWTTVVAEPRSPTTASSDGPIIGSAVGVSVGLLILCVVAGLVVAKMRARSREKPPDSVDEEVVAEAENAKEYHSALSAAKLYKANPVSDESSDAAAKYHGPPSVAVDIEPKSLPAKPKRKAKSKPKASAVEMQATGGSLVRKSARPTAAEVLHIPIDEVAVGKQLGAGAFGIVYKGRWHGKNVAIKQVKASNIAGGDEAIAEFEAEISKMASTSYHENLVQLHGVTTLENGDLAAVVEFCANGALVSALYGEKARADWSSGELFAVAHGAACGVAYLHRLGLIHRDIAARNVLLTKHDEAKVADFGMARLLADGVYAEQHTANAVGPLKWMAPEQMERRAYSRASDVFAFGVLLFEIFNREPPWRGVSNIITATKVVNGERMDVSSRDIPPAMAALMLECWAADASARRPMDHVQRVLHDNAPGNGSASQSES
jgi:hypothetical protein